MLELGLPRRGEEVVFSLWLGFSMNVSTFHPVGNFINQEQNCNQERGNAGVEVEHDLLQGYTEDKKEAYTHEKGDDLQP